MKPASWRLVIDWILERWNSLDKGTTLKPFKLYSLNLNSDGSEDNIIHLKDDQPCCAGPKLLREQLNPLMNPDMSNSNPFELTDSDIKEKH